MSENENPENKMDPLGRMFKGILDGYTRDFSIVEMLGRRPPWEDRRQFLPPSAPITPYERDSFNTASDLIRASQFTTYSFTVSVRSSLNEEEAVQAVRRSINERMARHINDALILPIAPVSNVPASNIPSTPTTLTADVFKEMMNRLPKDPLLEKGIERDWVCVVNYRTHATIEEYARTQPTMWGQSMSVDSLTGRRTKIVPVAENGLLYMPELEMYRRYADYFVARARAALARIRREKLRDIRRAYGHKYAADEKARLEAGDKTDEQ